MRKYYDIVKDFQSESDLKTKVGRLTIENELSKRNEELVNKKNEEYSE